MINVRPPIRRAAYPIIETERLLLRMFKAEDLDALHRLFNDADVQKYLSAANLRTREQMKVTIENLVRRWRERGFGVWCITDKSSAEVIGYCGFQYGDGLLEIELIFGLFKNYWRRWLASEAVKSALKFWIEELDEEKVSAEFSPKNIGSQKILEKNAFRYAKDSTCNEIETVIYTIYRHEYQSDDFSYKLSWDYYD